MLRSLTQTIIAASLLTAAVVVVSPTIGHADESGLASIHSWRRVGKKTCFIDHQHSGTGSGMNRKIAEMEAVRAWADFTALEYGTSWANFGAAIEKSMSCSGSSGNVQCNLDATPCRPW